MGVTKQLSAELRVLQAEIAVRAERIRETAGDWPCQRGCDGCCRKLADLPRATAYEWELIFAQLALLPPPARQLIEERFAEQARSLSRPTICPFLDREAGACLVYEQRPIACRTYGYYVERDRGLYCGIIEQSVERGEREEVVWGNHASVEARVDAMGPMVDFLNWRGAF